MTTNIATALVAYLKLQSGLTSLIDEKIYPEELPDKTKLPAVAYIKISDIKMHTLDRQNPLEQPYYQFTAYASTKAVAEFVKEQIKTALVDYVGTLSGITVQYIQLESEISDLGTDTAGILKVYTESVEFRVFYERS